MSLDVRYRVLPSSPNLQFAVGLPSLMRPSRLPSLDNTRIPPGALVKIVPSLATVRPSGKPGDFSPPPDSPAATGQEGGALVLFRLSQESATENLPLDLVIPAPGGKESHIRLDV